MGGRSRINPWERRLGVAVVGLLLLGLVGAAAIRIHRIRQRETLPGGVPIKLADVRKTTPTDQPEPASEAAVLEAQAREHDPLEVSPAGQRPSWTQATGDGEDRVEGRRDNFMPKAVASDGDPRPMTAAGPPETTAGDADGRQTPPDRTETVLRDTSAREPDRDGPIDDLTQPAEVSAPDPPASNPQGAPQSEPDDVAQTPGAESLDKAPYRATGSRYALSPSTGAPSGEVESPATEQQPVTPQAVEPNLGSSAKGNNSDLSNDVVRDPADPIASRVSDREDRLPARPGRGKAALRPGSDVAGRLSDTSASLAWTEQPAAAGGGAREYRVRAGESMWTIARDVYGSSAFFRALSAYNRSRYPDAREMRAGDVVLIPAIEQLRTRYATLCPPSPGNNVAGPVPQPDASPRRWYLVEEGDTLYDIARFELGQSARWTEIVELNRERLGDDFGSLRPGTRLLLPSGGVPDPVAARPDRDTRRY